MLWRDPRFQLILTSLEKGDVEALLRAAPRHHKKKNLPCCRRLKLVWSY